MDWIQLLQTVGVPIAAMIAMSYAIWKVGIWFGTKMIEPARDILISRIIKFVDHMDTTVDKVDDTAQAIKTTVLDVDVNLKAANTNLKEQTLALTGIKEINVKVQESTERVAVALGDQHQALQGLITSAVQQAQSRHELVIARLDRLEEVLNQVLARSLMEKGDENL